MTTRNMEMRLDLFLASLMQAHNGLNERLRDEGISARTLELTRGGARNLGLLRGNRIPKDQLCAIFGPPQEADTNSLRYDLILWPEHRYAFGVDEAGATFHQGYLLRDPSAALVDRLPLEEDAARSALQIGYHTFNEVERALGLPARTLAWWPREEWYFGPVRDDLYFVAEFDFGLLTGIQEQPYFSLDD